MSAWQVVLVLVGVAYLGFLWWFLPTAKQWQDPVVSDEPSPLHYLSGVWRRHYLSLFDAPTPLSAVHFLCGLVHYMVMVPLTCIFWLSAPVLNGIDRLAMRFRRASIKCGNAGCYARIELPVHVCPKCDARHKALRPGRHGLFQRICSCGSPLPSMLVCGRYTLKSLCPHCQQPLGWTFNQDLHIVLVAGPAAGKTSLLTGMFHALRQYQRDGMIRLQFASIDHERAFDNSLHAYQQGYVPDKTKATLPSSFVMQLLNRKREPLNVHVYDVAGEVYQDRESLHGHKYFQNADAVLFLVDPFSLSEVQMQAGERLDPYRDQVTACDELPQHVYDRLLSVLRSFRQSSSTVDMPIAVVLTKCDAFALNLGLPAPRLSGDEGGDPQEVRRWLDERGEGNLVRSVEHDFSRSSFFACSALGHLPEEEQKTPFSPVGVVAPFEWLLQQSGYALRTEERKAEAARPTSTQAGAAGQRVASVGGVNLVACLALVASLGFYFLPGLACKESGAAIAALISMWGFVRSTRVLGQGAWVAGLAFVFALFGAGLAWGDDAVARHKERVVAETHAAALQKAQEGDVFTARAMLAGLLADDDRNISARVELARIESQLVRFLLDRGETALAADEFDIADHCFRGASRLRGGESASDGLNRTLVARVAWLRKKGAEARDKGDLVLAEARFREVLKFDSQNEDAKTELADVLERRVALEISEGERLEKAEKFDAARERYKASLEIINAHKAAARHLAALEKTVTARMLADGDARLARKDFDGAEKVFNQVRERDGEQQVADARLGQVKAARIKALLAAADEDVTRKNFDKASKGYKRVQKLDKDNAAAKKGLARCRQGRHDAEIALGDTSLSHEDFDGAKKHFENAGKIIRGSKAASKGLARTEIASQRHDGYVEGVKVGKEIAGRADKPSSRENLSGAIRATEWRVQQQKEGIKDEPEPFRQGWRAGVDNAIRAEFIAALPPPPPPPPPEEHHNQISSAHLETVYYVILYDGSDDEAQQEMLKAQRAGLPARVFESRELPVTGPPATLVAIGPFKTPGITQEVVVRARRAGFSDAYSVKGRE